MLWVAIWQQYGKKEYRVDVTDRPYWVLIDAAREIHKKLYEIHSGRIPPADRQALIQ